ncbi:MAG: universal stress protein [Desulfovibrionaceae bacterium]
MDKNLLLTLGAESGSFHKIRFLSDFFVDKSRIKLTLFYVAPLKADEGFNAPRSCDLSLGEKIAGEARDMLAERGFAPANMETKVMCRRKGTVEDIREEAELGLYDAVVLGSRGLTWLEELVESSVGRGLLDQDIPFPVWICNSPETEGRDVLLCMDDSEHARRMADHVGFMVADQPETRVVLLHVDSKGQAADRAVEGARAALFEGRLSPDRVEVRVVQGGDVDRAIMAEVEAGRYGVVAVGMARSRVGPMARLFASPRCLKLKGRLEKASLWVSK